MSTDPGTATTLSGPEPRAAASRPVAVVGIGNPLQGDDGLGPRVVELLRDHRQRGEPPGDGIPAGVELIDGGTCGLFLLPALAGVAGLILVDAVDIGAPPGSIHLRTGAEVVRPWRPGGAAGRSFTVHHLGLADVVAVAGLAGVLPSATVLIGVQPTCLDLRLGLSAEVSAALPAVLDAVRLWCRALADSG